MDWTVAIKEERQVLIRIVALLFSFADLAEGITGRSSATRQIVLWILYPAESVARKMVIECCGPVVLPDARPAFSDGSPDDALRLAHCFRMLALALQVLVEQMVLEWAACFDPLPDDIRRGVAARRVGRAGAWLPSPAFLDTS